MPEGDKQSRTWAGRVFSLETVLGLVGISLVVAGLSGGYPLAVFWGFTTVAGLVVLHLIRKKDWQKHWEEKNEQFPAKKKDC